MLGRLCCLFCLLAAVAVRPAAGQCTPIEYFRQVGYDVLTLNSIGSTLIIGMPGLVEIHDASNPADPVRVGSIPVYGEPVAVETQGDMLYVATWNFDEALGSLVMADLATPGAPNVLATITWGDEVEEAAASNTRLCLLDGSGGILLMDITSPGQPITGDTLRGQDFTSIEVRQNILYAAFIDDSVSPFRAKLRTFNIADITSPNIITTVDLGEARGTATIDRLGVTLAALAADRLSMWSLSTPGTPALLGAASGARTGAVPLLAESGGTTLCHLIDSIRAAEVWDVTNAAAPVFRAGYPGSPTLLAPLGAGACAFDNDVLTSYSLADPAHPEPVWAADYGLPGDSRDVLVSGTNLVFTEVYGSNRITIIDVADPNHAVLRSTTEIVPDVLACDVSGTTLGFLTRTDDPDVHTFNVYSLADAAHPALLSDALTVENTSIYSNNEVDLDGDLGLIKFSNQCLIVDLADASRPRVASTVPTAGSTQARLEDGLLVVLDPSGTARLLVYDLDDRDHPAQVATIDEPNAETFGLGGRFLAVGRASGTTAVYDLSVPAAPSLRSTIPLRASMPWLSQVHVVGSICFLASSSGQAVYSLATPNNPALVGEFTLHETSYEAGLIGDVLWASGLTSVFAVRLPELARVTQQPQDRTPCPGATFTLTADAASDSPATYRWRSNGVMLDNGVTPNGTALSGVFTRTLTVSNFNPSDAGVFSLRISNSCGDVLSDNAIVAPGGGPVFAVQPQQVQACGLQAAVFTASAVGPPAPVVRWQAEFPAGSGTFINLSDTSNAFYSISGATTEVLTITPAPGGRLPRILQSRYRAVAGNLCGITASTPAALVLCAADVNCDGFLDFFDYDDFVSAFEGGSPAGVADFNGDGFVDFFDYDDFVGGFETGC